MPIIRSSRLPHMVCNALVAGGRWSVQRSRDEGTCSRNFPHPGRIAWCPVPDHRPPSTKALHTICSNNTSIDSSSWWWAYKCPKHVEQILSAINHSVASSWFSSLHYTMMHGQTYIKHAHKVFNFTFVMHDSRIITELHSLAQQKLHKSPIPIIIWHATQITP